MRPKVVIIGGGFGGLSAASGLNGAPCDIVLIDKTNHHLFQPLLYQVATAALSPGDIAAPIREILRKQNNVRILMANVESIDRERKKVISPEQEIPYDYLIVATGTRHSYFGQDHWEKFAPGLKTISDALKIRERILFSFEIAERLSFEDPEAFKRDKRLQKYMTFVIVGGGPTGVEIAGAVAEISKSTMLKDFKMVDTSKTKILLVEASDRLLQMYSPVLSQKAKTSLESLGVTVMVNTRVTDLNENGVKLGDQFIETPNVIWAAGNSASPLLKTIGTELDHQGRVIVDGDLSLKDDPNLFVIGDAACFIEEGHPLPGLAQVAIQQGRHVACIIKNDIPKKDRLRFKYFDKGSMATIGRNKAVAQFWKLRLSGYPAWLAWSLIHILYLIGYRNRYRVMLEWVWQYLTHRNGIRLITSKDHL